MKYDRTREFPRYELNLPLLLKIEPLFKEPYWEKCNILNISQKGMCFDTKASCNIGQILEVRIIFPGFEKQVHVIFQTIWEKRIIPESNNRIGGQFLYLENADQAKFRLFAEHYSNKVHSVTVCHNCGSIGNQIGLSDDELRDLMGITCSK